MLHPLPSRQGALELSFAMLGQTNAPFAAILATAFCDPGATFQDVERAAERGAVHREDLSQEALGHFSGEREGLQDRELRGAESAGAEGILIELGQSARCPPEVGAHAGELWNGRNRHTQIDAYTSIRSQRFSKLSRA